MFKRIVLTTLVYSSASFVSSSCGSSDSKGDKNRSGALEAPAETENFTTKLTYHGFAKDVYTKYCIACHSVPAVNGAPPTFRLDSYNTLEGYPGIKATAAMALKTIEDNSMPVGRSMKKDEREKLIEWLQAGAPEGDGVEVVEKRKAPTVSIINPLSANDVPDMGVYEISISAANFDSKATWDIFYTTVEGATTNGTNITTGLPIGQGNYTWDTTAMPIGVYFIYVRTIGNNGILYAKSAGSVEIVAP